MIYWLAIIFVAMTNAILILFFKFQDLKVKLDRMEKEMQESKLWRKK